MNKLTPDRQAAVVRALVEGCSIRSTVRMTGAAKNTVIKLLVDLGKACEEYQDLVIRNVPARRVQCDEIWAFVGCKEKNLTPEKAANGCGDIWTWTALDADTKLMVSWYVGERDARAAHSFITDVAARLANRMQLTTDGHSAYLTAVEDVFGCDIDYAMLVRIYGQPDQLEKRNGPPVCLSAVKTPTTGRPDPEHISTSYVERQNLTMRMSMRRFTRLTNAFSKKVENHAYAVALHFMCYNFARPHQSLKTPYPCTPAMAAGLADHVWKVEEVVRLLSD